MLYPAAFDECLVPTSALKDAYDVGEIGVLVCAHRNRNGGKVIARNADKVEVAIKDAGRVGRVYWCAMPSKKRHLSDSNTRGQSPTASSYE